MKKTTKNNIKHLKSAVNQEKYIEKQENYIENQENYAPIFGELTATQSV